jgi:hypothetical protein
MVLTIIDIDKYQYGEPTTGTSPRRTTMNPTPELIALIQLDRERDATRSRLAHLARAATRCCTESIGLLARLARAVRPSTAPSC